MKNSKEFKRAFLQASGPVLDEVLDRLFGQLSSMADEKDPPEDPFFFLNEITTEMQRSKHGFDRTGLRNVIDKAFQDMPEGEDLNQDFLKREINRVLTGRIAFDRVPWCYHVIGLPVGEDSYAKLSANQRAMQLQKGFRIGCKAATTLDDIKESRGVILEAPLSPQELLLAGAAMAHGCELVLIGHEELLPGVPTFQDHEDAFRDLLTRSRALSSGADEVDLNALEHPLLSPEALEASLELRAEILRQAYDALLRGAIFSKDRDVARSAELDLLMKEETTPEDIRNAYFQIVANGYRDGHSPKTAQHINGMRHKIEALEEQVEELSGISDPEL